MRANATTDPAWRGVALAAGAVLAFAGLCMSGIGLAVSQALRAELIAQGELAGCRFRLYRDAVGRPRYSTVTLQPPHAAERRILLSSLPLQLEVRGAAVHLQALGAAIDLDGAQSLSLHARNEYLGDDGGGVGARSNGADDVYALATHWGWTLALPLLWLAWRRRLSAATAAGTAARARPAAAPTASPARCRPPTN